MPLLRRQDVQPPLDREIPKGKNTLQRPCNEHTSFVHHDTQRRPVATLTSTSNEESFGIRSYHEGIHPEDITQCELRLDDAVTGCRVVFFTPDYFQHL